MLRLQPGREQVARCGPPGLAPPGQGAGLVAFLLSDGASFINATVVAVDGGQSEKH